MTTEMESRAEIQEEPQLEASSTNRDASRSFRSSAGESSSILSDLREIVRDLLQHRELLDQLTRRDIRIRYKQAVMGVAWAVIMPLVVVLSGWVLRIAFAEIAGAPLGAPVLAAIAVKSIGWAFFVGALGFGTTSITGNLPLVTKVYFPREVLPLASVLTQIADALIATAALALIWPFFGIGLSWAALWIVPLLLILLLLTTSAALIFSCLNVFFRDARHLVQMVMSFGIFFTPVFFQATAFGAGRTWIVMLNPLSPVLEGLRLALVDGHDLSQRLVLANGAVAWTPWYLLLAGLVSVVAIIASAVIFHRAEFRFAEYV